MCHSNVQHIYDQGVTDDALFIQVEYLLGGTLKKHTGSKGMEPERAWVSCATVMQGAPWRADGAYHQCPPPYFIGPEQALGAAEDERTDIYSMKAVFFIYVCRRKTLLGPDAEDDRAQHLHASVPALLHHYRYLQPLLELMMFKGRGWRCSAAEVLRHRKN